MIFIRTDLNIVTPAIDLIVQNQATLFVIRQNFRVVESFEAPNGKFANTFGNVLVIDSKYLMEGLSTSLGNNINGVNGGNLLSSFFSQNNNFLATMRSLRINDYAFEVDGVLKNREEYYLGNPETNEDKIIEAQVRLNLKMEVVSTAPVKESLEEFEFMKLFLQSTFATIVFFMVLLSVMLIYSLMLSDVDEKTYEMGMLRALGLRTVALVQLIGIQSTMFSSIGIIIGVIISALLNVAVRYFVFTYSMSHTTFMMSAAASLIGVAVGITMPMASNIWAIKRALGKKIRDSLDVFHTGINDVMVKIVKLESFGISPFELVLGVTLVVVGVLTYYVAPSAFLYDRLDLFFFILNIVLVGMIIGLAFLSFLIFPYMQTALVYLMTWALSFDIKLRPLIMKNMHESHKGRNAKTAMLFTIALAYLVFGGSSLLLIGNMIIGFVKNFVGSDVLLTSFESQNSLPEKELRAFLDKEIHTHTGRVDTYSFRGISMKKYFEQVFFSGASWVASSLGDFPEAKINLFPVDSSYINASLIDFYIPKHPQDDFPFDKTRGKPDYVESLFSKKGTDDYDWKLDKYNVISKNITSADPASAFNFTYDPSQQIRVILPEGIKDVLSIDGGDTIKLIIDPDGRPEPVVYRMLVRGLPKKMPGFFFMSYKQVQYFLQGVISFNQALELTTTYSQRSNSRKARYEAYKNKTDVQTYTHFYPKERLLVRLNSNLAQDDRDIIV